MDIIKTVAGILSYVSFAGICISVVDFFLGLISIYFTNGTQIDFYYFLIGSGILYVPVFVISIIVFIVSTYFFLYKEGVKTGKR